MNRKEKLQKQITYLNFKLRKIIEAEKNFNVGDYVKVITHTKGYVSNLVLEMKCSDNIGEIIKKGDNGYYIVFTAYAKKKQAGWFFTKSDLELLKKEKTNHATHHR